MESVTTTMHINEPKTICSTLSCVVTANGTEDIGKKLEDELLYGTGDDGDEEDALSDDSLRLRLSDDEADGDDSGASCSINNHHHLDKSEKTEPLDKASDVQSSDDNSDKHRNNSNGMNSVSSQHNHIDKQLIETDFTDDHHHTTIVNDKFCDIAATNITSHTDDSTTGINTTQLNINDKMVNEMYSNDDITKTPEIPVSNDNISVSSDKVSTSDDSNVSSMHNDKSKTIVNELIEVEDSNSGVTSVTPSITATINGDKMEIEENQPQQSQTADQQTPNGESAAVDDECEKSGSESKEIETETVKVSDLSITSTFTVPLSDDQSVDSPSIATATASDDAATASDDAAIASDDAASASDAAAVATPEPVNSESHLGDKNDATIKEVVDTEIHNVPVDPAVISINNDDSVIKKVNGKRSLSESEDESHSTKVPCQDTVRNDSTALNDEPMIVESLELKKESDESVKSTKATTVDNDIPKLVNGEVSSPVNGEIVSTELPMPALSIEASKDNENTVQDVPELESIQLDQQQTDITSRGKRMKRRRRFPTSVDTVTIGQEKENVRVRRETAQKAEERIRSKYLHDDSDSDVSESATTYVNWNKSSTNNARAASPPSLKRLCRDDEDLIDTKTVKKPKKEDEQMSLGKTDNMKSDGKSRLGYVRKFFLRDAKQNLVKPTQEELEELLIQKVIETITMRDEIGKLREQAKISERNLEATRVKFQQLAKQVKDFDMVLARLTADRRGNNQASPIKINRSVGLQVNFLSYQDQGVQNLRQLQQSSKATPNSANGGISSAKQPEESISVANGRKGIKVRSPRRSDVSTSPAASVATTKVASPQLQVQQSVSLANNSVPISKQSETRHSIGSTTQRINQLGNQTITLNGGNVTINSSRQTKILNVRSNNNNENLIDLTGEEDKSKNTNPPPLTAITTTAKDTPTAAKPTRFQRLIQTTPAPVNITPPTIRVIKPADKPTPTAIVNNMNPSQLTFIMQQAMGAGSRQLVITPNTTQIRPAITTNNRAPSYYTGVQTLSNGQVRVVPATTAAVPQKVKHPAPLPAFTSQPMNPALKLPPPAPSLKISKVAHGIVLSWNMALSDKYAEIASYQLYAYQEMNGVAPSTSLWKKVGDVRALPLPMACTLTQFSEGNNYYFAVRAVDTHSRLGQYSPPGNISL